MFKKADIVLACALLIIGFAVSYVLAFGQSEGTTLTITCDGETFGTYSLLEDKEITVESNGHINKITIDDGVVSMSFSDCSGRRKER